jgi:hypothetical protein
MPALFQLGLDGLTGTGCEARLINAFYLRRSSAHQSVHIQGGRSVVNRGQL